ncbi:MAG TPA: class I SAM-dependent methyltransferase [Polyangiaceae bacterium]|nr:class I SAM-dependent methyltransferase [Polyangiaceae bacterium]
MHRQAQADTAVAIEHSPEVMPSTANLFERAPRYVAAANAAVLAFACGTSGCGYPAVPAAWSQIDRDRPVRAPDVPYEPSSAPAIAAMLELGQPAQNEVVYDLGCGDGRVVIEAVRQSGARGVCVDIDPKLVRLAKENATRAGVAERIEFVTQDLFVTDLRDANVVFLFLWPEINRRLLPKLLRELRPGARIVSNMHDMGSFAPTQVITLNQGASRPHRVYAWKVGAPRAER